MPWARKAPSLGLERDCTLQFNDSGLPVHDAAIALNAAQRCLNCDAQTAFTEKLCILGCVGSDITPVNIAA